MLFYGVGSSGKSTAYGFGMVEKEDQEYTEGIKYLWKEFIYFMQTEPKVLLVDTNENLDFNKIVNISRTTILQC